MSISDVDSDVDTDTDVDMESDENGDTESDSDSDSGIGVTDSTDSTDTDSDNKDTSQDGGETGSLFPSDVGGDGDTDSDTDSDVDADNDTDKNVDTGTDMDTDTGSDTDTYVNTDTKSDTQICVEGDTDVCAPYHRCGKGECLPCREKDACGEQCLACDTETPVCENPSGTEPFESSRCVCDDNSCENAYCGEDGACAACTVDTHCGPDCGACGQEEPQCQGETTATADCYCTGSIEAGDDTCNPDGTTGKRCDSESGHCVDCTSNEYCGADCQPCASNAPICDASVDEPKDAVCRECITHEDCREGEFPFNSPLGVCTADHTCTCWVSEPRGTCVSSEDCPDGYACALEFSSHFVCLRLCDPHTDEPENGLICEPATTAEGNGINGKTVWNVSTTCFAYNHVIRPQEETCTDNQECGVVITSKGEVKDGECVGKCTYSCLKENSQGDLIHHDNLCPGNMCSSIEHVCVHDDSQSVSP